MKCIFRHKWSKWTFLKRIDNKLDSLEKQCTKCDKKKQYIGLTNVDIKTGYKTPYIYTDM